MTQQPKTEREQFETAWYSVPMLRVFLRAVIGDVKEAAWASWQAARTAPSGAEPADFNLRDADLAALLPGTYYMDPPDGGDVSLFEQLRRMSMDAAKWRRSAERPSGAELPALRSVELTRDTHGMCIVKINGREAIRDNGDVISHFATLDWFVALAPSGAELPALPEHIGQIVGTWLTPHDTDEFWGYWREGFRPTQKEEVYTAAQMHAYARSAILATSSQGEPSK